MTDIDPSDSEMLKLQETWEHRAALSPVLFVTDAEMLRRIGISEKIGRIAIRELEKRLLFPPKDPLFGNKRYWPAVRAFLDARSGVTTTPPKTTYIPLDPDDKPKA
jgi:hypothetical protein